MTGLRILLSDGSGLTARQTATQLAALGHRVEALSADPLGLVRFTRSVAAIHHVPRCGDDPLGWFDALLAVLDRPDAAGPVRVVLPTQEQVGILALRVHELQQRGVGIAVPPFSVLRRVQDKVSATATLIEHVIPQPVTVIARDRAELSNVVDLPVFVKPAIGTASTGVVAVRDRAGLQVLAGRVHDDAFAFGGLVVQRAVDGPLAMVQCVFDAGRLVAWHANLRTGQGPGGGASHKVGIDAPVLRAHCARLGAALAWHGALSLDAILPAGDPDGAVVIDVNPRLVEPGNAWRSGVDLVAALIEVSLGGHPAPVLMGRPGVATHQLLLAVLASGGRVRVWRELLGAWRGTGAYAQSVEELTPVRHDWRSAVPVVVGASASVVGARAAARVATGAVRNYAMSERAWRTLLTQADRGGPAER